MFKFKYSRADNFTNSKLISRYKIQNNNYIRFESSLLS